MPGPKPKNKKRRIIVILLSLLVVSVCLEMYLRMYWGFCDNVLMMESDKYEYIAQPNQDRFRFRNHIKYNSFSMRSPEPDSSSTKILGFGDSIINGGVAVEQDSLATTLLSLLLSQSLHEKIQVLNIGAGSWGPDNDFAYLQEKGNFNAKMMFLIVSSHDAYDNMDFTKVIDKVIRYESKQYKLGIWELIQKYAIPRLLKGTSADEMPVIKKGKEFNTGFMNFYNYCEEKKIPFFIYLHADKNEMTYKNYYPEGKEIIAFCQAHNIECIQDISTMKEEYYRGIIHMNNTGQRQMMENLYPMLMKYSKLWK